jgi:hypothetical protein
MSLKNYGVLKGKAIESKNGMGISEMVSLCCEFSYVASLGYTSL